MDDPRAPEFIGIALENEDNRFIMSRLAELEVRQAHLVAGSLCQTFWNLRAGLPAGQGINDYDIVYFDDDTSYEAEDRVITRARHLFSDVTGNIEVKNQARVPIWYEQKFGAPYPPTPDVRGAIDRYPFPASSLGLYLDDSGEVALYAPFTLDDVYDGIIRCNPALNSKDRYEIKAQTYKDRWPDLTVIPL